MLAAVTIEGRAQNAGLKQFAPRNFFDRELSNYYAKPVIFDAETAKMRSPQEYFQSASLGLGSLQLPDVFLSDPKNRQRLLRPVQTPDQKVIDVLRKFHTVSLESFEPAGDLIMLMRLVQAQQHVLCKFVKMLLKAMETRPDSFSWVSQALLEIENVENGRAPDKKAVPTLLDMYAASQGINLSSGQHAWDTLVSHFPKELAQVDFEMLGKFYGDQLSIMDGLIEFFRVLNWVPAMLLLRLIISQELLKSSKY